MISNIYSPNENTNYRADIDGLRALSVLAVMAYHAFPEYVSGGFVGVDVFFVISGYLISNILLNQLKQGQLRWGEFYSGRIRRIFPALVTVMFAVGCAGWFVLFAGEYEQLGRHIFAGSIFASNFLLWHEVAYFDNAATTKPFLHLWSLAVEEQFYLVWPACLWLMYRFRPWVGWFLILMIAISVCMALLTIQTDVSAAFYAPYLRIWELALGALLAWKRPRVVDHAIASFLSVCGLILIAFAIISFSASEAYPGWRALVPTLGAVMFIAADNRGCANKVLASRPMINIGLISYPLYLWHWPLLAFAHIVAGARPSSLTIWGCLALSFFLAWVTYRWIEMPIRYSAASPFNVVTLLSLMAGVGALGVLLHAQHGLPQRIPPSVAQQENRAGDWQFPPPEMQPVKIEGIAVQKVGGNGPLTLFFGDSNTEQYGVRIAELLAGNSSNQRGAVFLAEGAKAPIDGVKRSDNQTQTDITNFMQLALSPQVDRVVISAAWGLYFNSDLEDLGLQKDTPRFSIEGQRLESPSGREQAKARLSNSIKRLTSIGKKVYLIAGIPAGHEFGINAEFPKGRSLLLAQTQTSVDAKVPREQDEIEEYNWKFYVCRTHTQQRRGTGAR
jgi:peptidoglycan/LPS O-acetylase OafA/YrhL